MKNIMQMMQKAQEFQTSMETFQKTFEASQFIGSSGGDLVKVTIKGNGDEIAKIEVDDSLIKVEDKDMMTDLIAAAYNDAKKKATLEHKEKMKELTGGLSLPGGIKIPGLF